MGTNFNRTPRASSNLRRTDENVAAIITKWLEHNFYIERNGISNYCYNNELETQCKGIDTEFDFNGKHYICDEKCAVQYINRPLHTFAFELSFLDRGNNHHDGWLVDRTKVNNSFLCVWVDSANVNQPRDLTDVSQIRQVSLALISKNKILDYLLSLGWTKERLQIKSERLRNNEEENRGDIYLHGCKFSISRHLVEQPVNVLINRDKLMEIADIKCSINS